MVKISWNDLRDLRHTLWKVEIKLNKLAHSEEAVYIRSVIDMIDDICLKEGVSEDI